MSPDGRGRVTAALTRFTPDFVRRRFARKFVAVVVLAMLVMAIVGGIQYVSATSQVEAQTEERVESTARLQADSLSAWVDGLSERTKTFSTAQQFQRGDPETVRSYLFEEGQSLPADVSAIHYVDMREGRIEASTRPTLEGTTLAGKVPWASNLEAIDTKTNDPGTVHAATEPYQALGGDSQVIAFVSAPPKNTEHAIVMVANTEARTGNFAQTAEGGYTTIRRSDGSFIVGEPLAETNSTLPASHIGESGTVTNGSEVLGFASVEGTDWTVVTHTPKASAYAMRDTVGQSLLVMLAIGVLVLGGVAIGLGRRVGRTLDRLTDRARTIESGTLDVDLSTDRVDEFGRLSTAFGSMRDALRDQIAEAESAREEAERERERAQKARSEAEQARQEAEQLNDRLEATASEFGSVMDDCAEGDLSRRLPTDADSDAMVDVATAFNAMVEEWEATIREVRTFGTAVEQESSAVARRVDEARETSETLADSMGNIAEEATEQATDLQTVRDETEQLSASIEEASSSATEVATLADDLRTNGEAGRDAAQAAMDDLEAIEARTEAAVQQVTQLETLVADVEAVTDLIADIAEQTNMLALNANIEAARAADSDGFGVVAGEIKQLVEETQEATADIEATIEELKAQTDATTAEMTDAQQKVADGAETIEAALAALEAIVDDVEETADGIAEIDRAIAAQAESTQAVMTELETVTDVSTETATAAENAAGDARSQADRMGTVTEGVDDLSMQARQLDDLLATFETGGQAGEAQPALDSQPEHPSLPAGPQHDGAAAADGGQDRRDT